MYRIIDFTLSNCLNSGLKRVYVLTQHKSLSLDRHIRAAWSILHPELGEFIQTVPPQLQLVSRWYAGTADAVFQNLHLLEEERPQHVLIVSGDHIYRMDYEPLLQFHVQHDADLTIACTEVPRTRGHAHGRGRGGRRGACPRVRRETRAAGTAAAASRAASLVNMGVYVFKTEALVRAVIADAKQDSEHDFGRNIIPALVRSQRRVCAFDIVTQLPAGTRTTGRTWGLSTATSRPTWSCYSRSRRSTCSTPAGRSARTRGQHPPALMRNAGQREARAVNSIVSPGCIVSGGSVVRSVLSPRVLVEAGAVVEESILMPGVRVGQGSHVRRAIVDENVVISPAVDIGCDHDADRRRFVVTDGGVVIVPEGTLMG